MKNLEQRHIDNLRVVLSRTDLLSLLPKGGVVAELGVDSGVFSKEILTTNNPKKLYLIDSWSCKRYDEEKLSCVKRDFSEEIESDRVVIRRGRSEVEIQKFPDSLFDWIYIDTNHSYKQTTLELGFAKSKIKDGGIIAGHDFVCGNIVNGYKYGVIQAVHEFCVIYDWEIIYLTHEYTIPISFAIRKIEE